MAIVRVPLGGAFPLSRLDVLVEAGRKRDEERQELPRKLRRLASQLLDD
jgi:hypothetical protein